MIKKNITNIINSQMSVLH